MENKRRVMLVVMMLVMGNMLIETEAAMSFKVCYGGCLLACGILAPNIKKLFCPFMCIKDCRRRPLSIEANLKEMNQADYFCNLGCATDRCGSSSSIEDKDHVDKVSVCVDSCSDMCSHKN
ncbi:thionin-like protein 1 [Capsella rubella]|uniref:thionin-like protein 1 n=1 Tax=Capsella rubella TaxID=81985 RepID=UPI000CD4C88F|nr:thionin-like protein 1 [Capsella rubella]